MNAPLSRYLTRFAAEAVVAAPPPAMVVEPLVTLTVAELEDRLAAARTAARDEAEASYAAERAALERAHETNVAEAVATARADWCAGVAGDMAGVIERGFATLHTELSEATAKALRPLLAAAARERALTALEAILARLLAEPAHPAITVRAPADLVAALRARGLPDGIALVAADITEAVVSCGGTRIETRLAAALADIAAG